MPNYIAIMFGILGHLLSIWGFISLRHVFDIKKNWLTTTGTITNIKPDGDGKYDFDVLFQAFGTSRNYEGRDWSHSRKHEVGQSVTVRYDPGQPSGIVKINPTGKTWSYDLLAMLLVMGSGLSLIVISILHFLGIWA